MLVGGPKKSDGDRRAEETVAQDQGDRHRHEQIRTVNDDDRPDNQETHRSPDRPKTLECDPMASH